MVLQEGCKGRGQVIDFCESQIIRVIAERASIGICCPRLAAQIHEREVYPLKSISCGTPAGEPQRGNLRARFFACPTDHNRMRRHSAIVLRQLLVAIVNA